jgi:hypothetical protein
VGRLRVPVTTGTRVTSAVSSARSGHRDGQALGYAGEKASSSQKQQQGEQEGGIEEVGHEWVLDDEKVAGFMLTSRELPRDRHTTDEKEPAPAIWCRRSVVTAAPQRADSRATRANRGLTVVVPARARCRWPTLQSGSLRWKFDRSFNAGGGRVAQESPTAWLRTSDHDDPQFP